MGASNLQGPGKVVPLADQWPQSWRGRVPGGRYSIGEGRDGYEVGATAAPLVSPPRTHRDGRNLSEPTDPGARHSRANPAWISGGRVVAATAAAGNANMNEYKPISTAMLTVGGSRGHRQQDGGALVDQQQRRAERLDGDDRPADGKA
jgi:hypothetical protein